MAYKIQRVNDLVTAVTEFSFFYERRGLFESSLMPFIEYKNNILK